ncbi:MAG: right-handed parallel beta-helix repeat-containing protein [Pseudolysinimonas sp.]
MRLRGKLRRLSLAAVLALAGSLTACVATSAPPEQSVVEVPKDAATLADALEAVAPGGMILLSPGVYREQLVVNKTDVTVRGLDRNTTIIDGDGVRPYGVVGIADGVRIENLTVRNTTFYGVLVTGLHDENGPSANNGEDYEKVDPAQSPPLQRFAIDSVTAYNNGLYGIYAFDAQHGTITNSYASGSADSGFYVGQCPDCDIVVSGNVAERNAVGFENANASTSLTIVGNRFSNNRVGMTLISNYQEAFLPQSANVVTGNVISDNASADSPAQEDGGFGIGLGISGGQKNEVSNNLIEGNPRAGVLLASTEDLPAIDNSFTANSFASNGVDIANVSTARAPAMGNCVDGSPSSLPVELLTACAQPQPAATVAELPGGAAPPGISFLKVAPPIDQPGMPDPRSSPRKVPASVDRTNFPLPAGMPPADLLLGRTRP